MGQAYVSAQCRDTNQPHTIMYWLDDPNDPVPAPYLLNYDTQQDALDTVDLLIRKTVERPEHSALSWIKVFRTDNENYTCYRWERPAHLPRPIWAIPTENPPAQAPRERSSLWRRLLRRS